VTLPSRLLWCQRSRLIFHGFQVRFLARIPGIPPIVASFSLFRRMLEWYFQLQNDSLSLFFSCSHLEHKASVKRFVSLQFLNLGQSTGLLARGSARRKAATYIGQHKHRINADRHPCLEYDSNPRSQCSSERRQFMPQTARPL
jgi:hypothetical protein